VWSNPDLKWLDPAMGTGGFLIRAYDRLMDSLAEWEPDESARRKHILEQMIYGVELQAKNVVIARMILDLEGEYKLNFAAADSLAFDYWGGVKFDVVVGNPPYQDPNNKNKAHPLWVRFFEKMFADILKDNAMLMFVTPDSWRTKNSRALHYFATYDVDYVDFDIKNHFPQVGSTFCWSLLRKSQSSNLLTTLIKGGQKYQVSLRGIKFLPDPVSIPIVNKIMNGTSKIEVVGIGAPFRSDSVANVSLEYNNVFQYRLFHTNKETYFSIDKHPNLEDRKVIINKTGKWNPFYDDGEMGFTHINFALIVKDEVHGHAMQEYLNSKLIRFFIGAMNVFGARDKYTIENIPLIDGLADDFTDQDIYDYFNLTKEEIDLIESVV